MKQVKEVTGIQADNIPEYLYASEAPLLLKGFGANWPMVKAGLASPQEAGNLLQSYYSGEPVSACRLPPEAQGRVFYNKEVNGFNFEAARIDLSQVLSKLFEEISKPTGTTYYVASTEVSRYFPGFKEEHNSSLDNFSPLTSLWIGNQSRVAAHYDFPLNIACSLVGNRRFTLFAPEQISNLYPGPMEFAPGGQDVSMVDFHNPDFDKFPKFKTALENAIVAELEPGDALFIPSMWWHHVEALSEFSVLLSHWWRDTPAFMGRPNNALLNAMLSLRNLPKAQRQAWKAIFDHYIFEHEENDFSYLSDNAKGMLKRPIDELTARRIRAELLEKLKR
ncbi:cupin-like domain-containing protein [Thalassotalea euphylliae]|uniref:cupin-like domain-containing protein n=1 Tax=Thalassotalea euphylliae TaxID=1655234 RepID=UPI003630AB88